jgi:hypothetical protein
MVRMNTASSQTSTVLLTLPPLSDDLLHYRLDVEDQHPLPLDLDRFSYNTRQRKLRSIRSRELIYWHVVNVANIVNPDPNPPLEIIDKQNEAFRACIRPLSECDAPVDHRHDRPTQVYEATNRFGRARQPGHLLRRNDLAKWLHVAGKSAGADIEHQQSSGRDARLFLDGSFGGQGYGVTHRIGAP